MRGFIFGSHLFNFFRGFNFSNWLSIDFLRGFTLVLSIFLVLHILVLDLILVLFYECFIYFEFLVVCFSVSSM